MKLVLTFLILAFAAVTLTNGQALPENFPERVDAILKWFEMRISVYRKANILLQQLARKVNALPAYHDGIDVYYRRWIDFPGSKLKLTLSRGVINGTERVLVSELLKQTLEREEISEVLTLMPEVRSAFNKLV